MFREEALDEGEERAELLLSEQRTERQPQLRAARRVSHVRQRQVEDDVRRRRGRRESFAEFYFDVEPGAGVVARGAVAGLLDGGGGGGGDGLRVEQATADPHATRRDAVHDVDDVGRERRDRGFGRRVVGNGMPVCNDRRQDRSVRRDRTKDNRNAMRVGRDGAGNHRDTRRVSRVGVCRGRDDRTLARDGVCIPRDRGFRRDGICLGRDDRTVSRDGVCLGRDDRTISGDGASIPRDRGFSRDGVCVGGDDRMIIREGVYILRDVRKVSRNGTCVHRDVT